MARPAVTAISPRSGPVAGGNVVTITGTGFTGATSVRFGTVTTTHFTVKSSTKITVTVPAQSAGTHDVNVTTAGGRSVSNSVDKYTYGALPTVTSLSPSSGTTAGGNVITITGTGFTGATSVRFGTVSTTHFTVKSSTKITVTVPAQKAGTHDVNVTTPAGRSVSNSVDKYTYK